MRKGAIAMVVAVALCCFTGGAGATTGALELVHPPRVIVPYARAVQFEGRFVLRQVGNGADIRSGGMKIEFSPGSVPMFLVGAAQFYQYNPDGQIETALFTLFPFRETPTGVTAQILKKGLGDATRTPPLGTITLERPTADGRIEGELELHGGGPYPVVFSRLAPDEAGYDHSPPARQVREAPAGLEPGWSADPAVAEGEYQLADPAVDESGMAGSLAPLIAVTQHLGPHGSEPTGGDLAVLRGEVPIGEVNLEFGALTQTYYLTDLSRRGAHRVADVRSGSPEGPKVGHFAGTQGSGALEGTLAAGGSRYSLSFKKGT
jgi:hypothetical protein